MSSLATYTSAWTLPQNTDVVASMDALSSVFKAHYASTAADTAAASRTSLASSLAPQFFAQLSGGLDSLVVALRPDTRFRADMRNLIQPIETAIGNSPALPGWILSSPTSPHILDGWLTRGNGAYGAPATPASASVLTAAFNSNGALPSVVSGSAPRVVYTYVGANDYNESLPSPESTQVAIAGANNSYSCTIPGVIPAGVTKIRWYRSIYGGSTGAYLWDHDTPVSSIVGSVDPIGIVSPDNLLRPIAPPSWMSLAMSPEAATLFALAWSSASVSGQSTGPTRFNSGAMLSPANVLLGRSDGFVGIGNTPAQSILAVGTVTGSNAVTNTAGSIQVTNNAPLAVQGYGGAMGLQARVTSALTGSGTSTVTISYMYYDAAHGWGSGQAATATATFAALTLGSLAPFTIPAGRVIYSVTVTAVNNLSAGSFILEGVFPRSY